MLMKYYAPFITSPFGVVSTLSIYTVATVIAAFFLTNLEIDFKISYIIGGDLQIKHFLEKAD